MFLLCVSLQQSNELDNQEEYYHVIQLFMLTRSVITIIFQDGFISETEILLYCIVSTNCFILSLQTSAKKLQKNLSKRGILVSYFGKAVCVLCIYVIHLLMNGFSPLELLSR
jgi:hypothetical protein